MPTKTIRIANTKEKQGKYGPSLQVGEKAGDEWVNYYVNKPEFFSYFTKGATVTVEYEVNKGGYNIITGVAPQRATTPSGNGDNEKNKSIELQVLVKAYASMLVGGDVPLAAEFAAWVTAAHRAIFNPEAVLADAKKQAEEALGAEEEDESFPF